MLAYKHGSAVGNVLPGVCLVPAVSLLSEFIPEACVLALSFSAAKYAETSKPGRKV